MFIAVVVLMCIPLVSANAMQEADLLQRNLWYPRQNEGAITGEPLGEPRTSLRKRPRRQRGLPVAVPVQVADPVPVDHLEDPIFALTMRDILDDNVMVQMHAQPHLPLSEALLDYGVFDTHADDGGTVDIADTSTDEATTRRYWALERRIFRIALICSAGLAIQGAVGYLMPYCST